MTPDAEDIVALARKCADWDHERWLSKTDLDYHERCAAAKLARALLRAVETLGEIANWQPGFYDNRDNQEADSLADRARECLAELGGANAKGR